MRNPLIALNVNVQGRFLGSDLDSFNYVRKELSNHREGFFKLECLHDLTPSEVYDIYRRRDTVEKLIDSLKNHIEIKPLRVWLDNSVRGVLLLCFLAQVIVSMIRFEHTELRKSLTKFIIRSLEKLTLTHGYEGNIVVRRVFSNFEPINLMILGDSVVKTGVSGG